MKKYPAKILLFGEHTVNLGSQALAMPLDLYAGHWDFSDKKDKWADRLMEFAEYLSTAPLFIKLDMARFKKELSDGLHFASNIPTGYGVGSSGALVAAIFDRYCMVREGKDLTMLKKTLAQMEGFFHGTSSGTDPLICYLNSAVILSKEGIGKAELPKIKKPYSLFLLDTKIQRSATPLIEYFLEKNKDVFFQQKINNDFLPIVDQAINYFVEGDWGLLFDVFNLISEFQFLFLEKMIPDNFLEVWKSGMDSDFFKLKICGAGGGGFILGMTNDFERMEREFKEYKFIEVSGIRGQESAVLTPGL
ncbi:MAG: hypothetical protein AAFZ15_18990 [Bacteroidota bacterium]